MNAPEPILLMPLAAHLGVNLTLQPFPHSHASAHATGEEDEEGDAADDPRVQALLVKLERIYKQDVVVWFSFQFQWVLDFKSR
jgi:hypothetical protein